ncbi:MAG: fatty acid desaturase family protein [Sphingobium phenoxybenzoativorans]
MYFSELDSGAASGKPALPPRSYEDKALLRAAAALNQELSRAKPAIYWTDMLLSAAVGYAGLFVAMTAPSVGVAIAGALVAMLLLYRASSFIHEISHLKPDAVPGFHTVWNLIAGVPLMIPSFMYEGVHTLHHHRARYGTVDDPEYLPLSRMRTGTLAVFMAAAALAPIGFLIRHAVLVPLSLLSPRLRGAVMEKYSALAINPQFRRPAPDAKLRRSWALWEGVASLWSIGLIALVAAGVVPLRAFLVYLAVLSGAMIVNQVRTLVAHLWENDGEEMSITAQYLDSVNVPPPGYLPVLWAPVGLRYHAIHHLLPGLPYHALGEAHSRLIAAMPEGTSYHRANYRSLRAMVMRLVRASMGAGRG